MAFITPLTSMKPMEDISTLDKVQKTDSESSFESKLEKAINGVKELETQSDKAAYDLAVGNTDDLTSVMLASAKATTAVQMTTQITARAVNTYREIMQMNI